MVSFNRVLISIELFGFWLFMSVGPEPVAGQISFVAAGVAAAWSVYNGIKWHFAHRDGEGAAWCVIGVMVFLGLTARWLVHAA